MRCCSPEPLAQLGEAVARAWQDHNHRCTCRRAGLASTCCSCSAAICTVLLPSARQTCTSHSGVGPCLRPFLRSPLWAFKTKQKL